MNEDVGATVIDVLEAAGGRHLEDATLRIYPQFLFHIGGADTLRAYDGTVSYWHRVQAILDTFFTAVERAEIVGRLIDRPALRSRPEFRTFLAQALAERQLQVLLRDMTVACASTAERRISGSASTD